MKEELALSHSIQLAEIERRLKRLEKKLCVEDAKKHE